MSGFLGSFLHQIDGKGRVSLPASFRREADGESFVLIHVHPDALSLYPEESWLERQQSLREMMRRNPESRRFILGLTANATEVAPDKQGRILIPDRLREAIGLGEEALIVGAIDKVEVWDPDRFEASEPPRSDEFQKLVGSIFA